MNHKVCEPLTHKAAQKSCLNYFNDQIAKGKENLKKKVFASQPKIQCQYE